MTAFSWFFVYGILILYQVVIMNILIAIVMEAFSEVMENP
jgi:hypothetical protein